jgi:hypothetical protein
MVGHTHYRMKRKEKFQPFEGFSLNKSESGYSNHKPAPSTMQMLKLPIYGAIWLSGRLGITNQA